MKKYKLILWVATIFLSILVWAPISVSAYTDGNYTYTVFNGEATITDFSSSAVGEVIIPEKLGGYPVTSIGDYAF